MELSAQAADWVFGLKDAIADLHQAIESEPLAIAMAEGTIDPSLYGRLLNELFPLHSWIESRSRHLPETLRSLCAIAQDSATILWDLEALDIPLNIACLNGTRRLLQELEEQERCHPTSIMGAVYLLGGSRMGSRVIVKGLRNTIGIEGVSTRGLDYHLHGSEDFPREWQAFKHRLAKSVPSEETQKAVTETALLTMQGLKDIYAEIGASMETEKTVAMGGVSP